MSRSEGGRKKLYLWCCGWRRRRAGVGTLAPTCRPLWNGQHRSTGSWLLPLAGNGGWSQTFLSALPNMPENVFEDASPSPLIPLPIIEVPFEHMEPLPKSAWGHEHILIILDYATRYPEAVPLQKATAKSIAPELFLLCSRVGIPAKILTDQGTSFICRLMADLCTLLKMKQLRTSVYHTQTDGLVEPFNQTLTQMLRWVAAEDKRDWDLMLPYILFGIWGTSGFDRLHLFRATVWPPAPGAARCSERSVGTTARAQPLRDRTCERDERTNRPGHAISPVAPHQGSAGAAVALQPNHPTSRVTAWRPSDGPCPQLSLQIPGQLAESVYHHGEDRSCRDQPGRRREDQLYQINLLKKWVGTRDQLAALITVAQKVELQHLVGQLSDVFSPTPGQTQVLHHEIHMPPGTIVRDYRVPEARRRAIEEKIQQMLKLGVIEPSNSPWSSPIVMVPKPDGTLHCQTQDGL